ncbi:MAG: hypothetical protein Q8K86_07375, partial [Candidatus Nanopelagicaceae bacterium]|nr:hypothetical protein [Candidatus Nanopelagicaceae bacterium]
KQDEKRKEKIHSAINELRDEEERLYGKYRSADTMQYIGKCFVSVNGSCGKKWKVFERVIGLEKDGFPIMFSFQSYRTDEERLEMRIQKHWVWLSNEKWNEISYAQFKREWKKFEKKQADVVNRAFLVKLALALR